MKFEILTDGIVFRVRLTPNSSVCKENGWWVSPEGDEYLKINVISVPEKGKANQELVKFLSKNLKVAKSNFKIISGELDRYKKILISGNVSELEDRLNKWLGNLDDCADN